jgi:hypothetical protein
MRKVLMGVSEGPPRRDSLLMPKQSQVTSLPPLCKSEQMGMGKTSGYSLDLKYPSLAHVLKAWSPEWHYWETVELSGDRVQWEAF